RLFYEPRIVGMHADGGVDEIMFQRQGQRLLNRGFLWIRAPDCQQKFHTRFARALDHLRPVGVKLRHVQVGVGVGDHERRSEWKSYLRREPLGTSSVKVARTGLPSTDAATIIPFDSTPMSLAGFRLTTTTTLRLSRVAPS